MRQFEKNDNTVVGGTVVVLGSINLGNTPVSVTLASSVISQTGTYTIFRSGTGILWDGSALAAGTSLLGKVNLTIPAGYAIQSWGIDSTGLNAVLVVRTVATA